MPKHFMISMEIVNITKTKRNNANNKIEEGFFIFNSIKNKIYGTALNLAESILLANASRRRSKTVPSVKKNSTRDILPKNKFTISIASLMELAGLTRKDNFYRCDYDLEDIHNAIEADSYLKVAVQKYKQMFFKAGYDFKSSNDAAVEYLKQRFRIMDYYTEQSTDILWREIAGDLEAYSNAFVIKARVDKIPFVQAKGIGTDERPVGGYYRVNPARMQVQYNDEGKLIGYKQVTIAGREKKYKKEDVIHFTLDREGGSIWGTPRCVAVLEDIKLLRQVEGNVLALIYRFAMPLYQMIVGLPEQGKEGTKKEVEDARRTVERTPMDGMYITTERTQIKVVGSEGNALDVNGYLGYFEKRAFTGLNVSESMMGRGGSKQDADSMEEQAHNIVKDDQVQFALQFRTGIINELLMEGGFNPVINENDIVTLDFREINLDTKVKVENHEISKFEKNAITWKELRQHLGEKIEGIDENDLFSQKFGQANQLEQIQAQNDAAIKLAQVNGDIQIKVAKASATNTQNKSNSSYTKKNTGNGKTTNTISKTKTVTNNDRPQNQHGTYSAKIKESLIEDGFIDNVCKFYDRIVNDLQKSSMSDVILAGYKNDLINKLSSRIKECSAAGSAAAFSDRTDNRHKTISLNFESSTIKNYTKLTIDEFFSDIEKNMGNSRDRADLDKGLKSMKYRLKFLADFVETKSFWYSYAKTLEFQGIKEMQVCGKDNSSHADKHKILNTKDFEINDIPGFSANCHCYLSPIRNED